MVKIKIVVALDSFKGGLGAAAVCEAVAAGLHEASPDLTVLLKPMADGGEGTAAALLASRPGGEWVGQVVCGPVLGREVEAGFAWFADDGTAVVEMASASGLPLLAEGERNPLSTSTFGTGQLLLAAASRGARRILLTIGGSATVDGGVGAASALGWRFLDKSGVVVLPDGGHLREIVRIEPPAVKLRLPPVTVLCDVTNPLCGPCGAAAVFGPQKGATPAMVAILEEGLSGLAELIWQQLGVEVRDVAGGGAAGGLGAGARAFFGGELAPGIATVIAASGLDEALSGAAWCITGEGSFDGQSLAGKVVSGVAASARAAGVPVVVMAGRVKVAPEVYREHGIVAALATHGPEMPMAEVLRREGELLRETAASWWRGVSGGDVPA